MKNKKIFIYISILILLSAFSIFILPFYIQSLTTSVSASYDYQFNNIISIASVLIFLLIGFIVLYKYILYKIKPMHINQLFTENTGTKIGYKNLIIVSAVPLLIIIILFFFGAGYGFGETNYFLLRIDKLHRGQLPFLDFEFSYGPLLIYLPKYIDDLFGIKTSIIGYYVTYVLLTPLGLYFLLYVVNSFNIDKSKKTLIFYIVAISSLPITLGLNYTFFRFITPIVSIFIFNRIIHAHINKSIVNQFILSVGIVIISLFNFIISPEIGIAIFIALESYLCFLIIFNKQFYLICTLAGNLVLILVLSGLLNSNQILILKSFASGGNNWVVIPSLSILLYLVSFFTINIILSVEAFSKKFPFIPFALVVFNCIMLCGAFGRCDPAHIFYNGLGTLIVMWAFLSYIQSRYLKLFNIVFIFTFTIAVNAIGLDLMKNQYVNLIINYAYNHNGFGMLKKTGKSFHILNFVNKFIYYNIPRVYIDFNLLKKYKIIAVPFDTDKNLYIFLLNNNLYQPEYYTGPFLNVYTPNQINTKLNTLQDSNHKYMIISKYILSHKRSDNFVHNQDRKFISLLFCYPYRYNQVKFSKDMYEPVFRYIQANYRVVTKVINDEVLVERR